MNRVNFSPSRRLSYVPYTGSIYTMKDIFNSPTVYVPVSMILVGIGSFLLGGLAVYTLLYEGDAGGEITLEPILDGVPDDRRVYASKRGKRYYPWWCDKGSTILEENRVWYLNPESAELDGYTIAKGCA